MLHLVKRIIAAKDFSLILEFNTGEIREVDLRSKLLEWSRSRDSKFRPLLDSDYFGRVKLETTKGPKVSNRLRWLMAFLGGTLFLYGARMARGCTSGQALTGGATLSAGSWVIMFSIFGGAYALAYFVRKFWL